VATLHVRNMHSQFFEGLALLTARNWRTATTLSQ